MSSGMKIAGMMPQSDETYTLCSTEDWDWQSERRLHAGWNLDTLSTEGSPNNDSGMWPSEASQRQRTCLLPNSSITGLVSSLPSLSALSPGSHRRLAGVGADFENKDVLEIQARRRAECWGNRHTSWIVKNYFQTWRFWVRRHLRDHIHIDELEVVFSMRRAVEERETKLTQLEHALRQQEVEAKQRGLEIAGMFHKEIVSLTCRIAMQCVLDALRSVARQASADRQAETLRQVGERDSFWRREIERQARLANYRLRAESQDAKLLIVLTSWHAVARLERQTRTLRKGKAQWDSEKQQIEREGSRKVRLIEEELSAVRHTKAIAEQSHDAAKMKAMSRDADVARLDRELKSIEVELERERRTKVALNRLQEGSEHVQQRLYMRFLRRTLSIAFAAWARGHHFKEQYAKLQALAVQRHVRLFNLREQHLQLRGFAAWSRARRAKRENSLVRLFNLREQHLQLRGFAAWSRARRAKRENSLAIALERVVKMRGKRAIVQGVFSAWRIRSRSAACISWAELNFTSRLVRLRTTHCDSVGRGSQRNLLVQVFAIWLRTLWTGRCSHGVEKFGIEVQRLRGELEGLLHIGSERLGRLHSWAQRKMHLRRILGHWSHAAVASIGKSREGQLQGLRDELECLHHVGRDRTERFHLRACRRSQLHRVFGQWYRAATSSICKWREGAFAQRLRDVSSREEELIRLVCLSRCKSQMNFIMYGIWVSYADIQRRRRRRGAVLGDVQQKHWQLTLAILFLVWKRKRRPVLQQRLKVKLYLRLAAVTFFARWQDWTACVLAARRAACVRGRVSSSLHCIVARNERHQLRYAFLGWSNQLQHSSCKDVCTQTRQLEIEPMVPAQVQAAQLTCTPVSTMQTKTMAPARAPPVERTYTSPVPPMQTWTMVPAQAQPVEPISTPVSPMHVRTIAVPVCVQPDPQQHQTQQHDQFQAWRGLVANRLVESLGIKDDLFRALDKNGNGRISREEWHAAFLQSKGTPETRPASLHSPRGQAPVSAKSSPLAAGKLSCAMTTRSPACSPSPGAGSPVPGHAGGLCRGGCSPVSGVTPLRSDPSGSYHVTTGTNGLPSWRQK